MKPPMMSRRSLVSMSSLLLSSCVGADLVAPETHPGHSSARAGKRQTSTALGPEHDLHVEESAPPPPPVEPASGDVVYTCPMHPEIVRQEPGNCPICGMKLVARKGAK